MNDSINTQLEEMEQFLHTADNLKFLIENIGDIETADKNDLYDLIYTRRKIESWLEQDIQNKNIKENLERVLKSIELIENSLSNEHIEKIWNNKLKPISKLNASKYGNKKEYKGLKAGRITVSSPYSIIPKYIMSNINTLIGILIFTLILPHLDNLANSDISILKIIGMLRNTLLLVMITIIVCTLMIRMVIDAMYITMPILRSNDLFGKIVSHRTKEIIEECSRGIYEKEEKEKVNYKNRIETATDLLNELKTYVKNMSKAEISMSDKDHIEIFISHKESLQEKVDSISKGAKSTNILKKLEALADAEIIYREIHI